MSIIIQIAIAVVITSGGISGIILALIKFSSNIIADKLSKKYELKLNKELEKYKSNLDSKIYITKAKFDKEFELYQQLSRNFFYMIEKVHALYPMLGTKSKNELLNAKIDMLTFNEAQVATVKAQECINSYAAFIAKDFYEKYKHILEECRGFVGIYNELEKPKLEQYKETLDVINSFELLNDDLREYLSKLEVIEGAN